MSQQCIGISTKSNNILLTTLHCFLYLASCKTFSDKAFCVPIEIDKTNGLTSPIISVKPVEISSTFFLDYDDEPKKLKNALQRQHSHKSKEYSGPQKEYENFEDIYINLYLNFISLNVLGVTSLALYLIWIITAFTVGKNGFVSIVVIMIPFVSIVAITFPVFRYLALLDFWEIGHGKVLYISNC